jgi:prephenate dehydrogenase
MTNQITIIGVGLIGGSFALALKEAGFNGELVGYGRHEKNLQRALKRGIVDRYSVSLADAVRDSDLVLLAAPVGVNDQLLPELATLVDRQCVVTDAGSVKQSFVASARRQFSSIENVVPAHPIAGTEHSGVEAGFATLYHGKRLIITPLAETSAQAIEKVSALWEMAGALIETMSPERHDKVFAATSHLPHVLAFTLVETLFRMDQKEEVLRYASGGFSDFTRIASSDPVMWRDICLHNRDSVLEAMRGLEQGLDALTDAIRRNDGEAIESMFRVAKETRDEKIISQAVKQ